MAAPATMTSPDPADPSIDEGFIHIFKVPPGPLGRQEAPGVVTTTVTAATDPAVTDTKTSSVSELFIPALDAGPRIDLADEKYRIGLPPGPISASATPVVPSAHSKPLVPSDVASNKLLDTATEAKEKQKQAVKAAAAGVQYKCRFCQRSHPLEAFASKDRHKAKRNNPNANCAFYYSVLKMDLSDLTPVDWRRRYEQQNRNCAICTEALTLDANTRVCRLPNDGVVAGIVCLSCFALVYAAKHRPLTMLSAARLMIHANPVDPFPKIRKENIVQVMRSMCKLLNIEKLLALDTL